MFQLDEAQHAKRIYREVYCASAGTRIIFLLLLGIPAILIVAYTIAGYRYTAESYAWAAGIVAVGQVLLGGFRIEVSEYEVRYRDIYRRWHSIEWSDVRKAAFGVTANGVGRCGLYNLIICGHTGYTDKPLAINTKPFDLVVIRRIAVLLAKYAPSASVDDTLRRAAQEDMIKAIESKKSRIVGIVTWLFIILTVAAAVRAILR